MYTQLEQFPHLRMNIYDLNCQTKVINEGAKVSFAIDRNEELTVSLPKIMMTTITDSYAFN